HVWAASTLGSVSLFGVEMLLGLPVLTLSPVLAVLAGMVFLVKAGMLSGWFYLAAAACFVTAALMAIFPSVGLLLFGSVSAVCFFYPGLKDYRQRIRGSRLVEWPRPRRRSVPATPQPGPPGRRPTAPCAASTPAHAPRPACPSGRHAPGVGRLGRRACGRGR